MRLKEINLLSQITTTYCPKVRANCEPRALDSMPTGTVSQVKINIVTNGGGSRVVGDVKGEECREV